MDINWVRSLFTLWVFISFILVLYVVFNRHNKTNYDDAANSIFLSTEENEQDKGER